MQWLLAGHDERQITEALAVQHPGRKPQAILTAVIDHLQRQGQADPDVVRGWAIEATRVIYQKMMDIGDYANAMKAIKQIMSLAPRAVDVHDDDQPADANQDTEADPPAD